MQPDFSDSHGLICISSHDSKLLVKKEDLKTLLKIYIGTEINR
jgi:hypothetical protein